MGVVVKVDRGFATAPDPCTKTRAFKHHWSILKQSKPGDTYAEGRCLYCKRRRLFKVAWPTKLDWLAAKAERQAEEQRRFNKGRANA